ncbi:hypothetical protein GCM10023405_16550 [Streptomonospora salina]
MRCGFSEAGVARLLATHVLRVGDWLMAPSCCNRVRWAITGAAGPTRRARSAVVLSGRSATVWRTRSLPPSSVPSRRPRLGGGRPPQQRGASCDRRVGIESALGVSLLLQRAQPAAYRDAGPVERVRDVLGPGIGVVVQIADDQATQQRVGSGARVRDGGAPDGASRGRTVR